MNAIVSMNLLWYHSNYSIYKFYQFKIDKLRKEKPIKQLSVAFGALGQTALLAGFTGKISYPAMILSASTLSIAHFWTMEVDYKYRLQVRPYAYLPFPLAAAAIYYGCYSHFKKDI